jgi:hypothetical protein
MWRARHTRLETKEDIPSSLLKHPPRAIGDLLVRVTPHCVAGLLLDEIESCRYTHISTCSLSSTLRKARLTLITIILIPLSGSSSALHRLLLLLLLVLPAVAEHCFAFLEEIHCCWVIELKF